MPDSSPAPNPTQPPSVPSTISAARYLAWLYSPPAQQPIVAALCEIENEVLGSLRPGVEHHVAHARLQWWREECERTSQRQPLHPLTRELLRASIDGTAAADISGLVDTAVWDLARATFETRKELTAYCERWTAAMFQWAGAVSTSVTSNASPWRKLGAAVREIELLANLAPDAHAGRLRVPLDELDSAGVDVKGIGEPPWPASLVSLLRERHEKLRAAVGHSVSVLSATEQADFRGLMVWAALARQQSLRAQRALPSAILPRRYHALSDGWQAWRAARRAVGGHLRLG